MHVELIIGATVPVFRHHFQSFDEFSVDDLVRRLSYRSQKSFQVLRKLTSLKYYRITLAIYFNVMSQHFNFPTFSFFLIKRCRKILNA